MSCGFFNLLLMMSSVVEGEGRDGDGGDVSRCGECGKRVAAGRRAVVCKGCGIALHKRCSLIDTASPHHGQRQGRAQPRWCRKCDTEQTRVRSGRSDKDVVGLHESTASKSAVLARHGKRLGNATDAMDAMDETETSGRKRSKVVPAPAIARVRWDAAERRALLAALVDAISSPHGDHPSSITWQDVTLKRRLTTDGMEKLCKFLISPGCSILRPQNKEKLAALSHATIKANIRSQIRVMRKFYEKFRDVVTLISSKYDGIKLADFATFDPETVAMQPFASLVAQCLPERSFAHPNESEKAMIETATRADRMSLHDLRCLHALFYFSPDAKRFRGNHRGKGPHCHVSTRQRPSSNSRDGNSSMQPRPRPRPSQPSQSPTMAAMQQNHATQAVSTSQAGSLQQIQRSAPQAEMAFQTLGPSASYRTNAHPDDASFEDSLIRFVPSMRFHTHGTAPTNVRIANMLGVGSVFRNSNNGDASDDDDDRSNGMGYDFFVDMSSYGHDVGGLNAAPSRQRSPVLTPTEGSPRHQTQHDDLSITSLAVATSSQSTAQHRLSQTPMQHKGDSAVNTENDDVDSDEDDGEDDDEEERGSDSDSTSSSKNGLGNGKQRGDDCAHAATLAQHARTLNGVTYGLRSHAATAESPARFRKPITSVHSHHHAHSRHQHQQAPSDRHRRRRDARAADAIDRARLAAIEAIKAEREFSMCTAVLDLAGATAQTKKTIVARLVKDFKLPSYLLSCINDGDRARERLDDSDGPDRSDKAQSRPCNKARATGTRGRASSTDAQMISELPHNTGQRGRYRSSSSSALNQNNNPRSSSSSQSRPATPQRAATKEAGRVANHSQEAEKATISAADSQSRTASSGRAILPQPSSFTGSESSQSVRSHEAADKVKLAAMEAARQEASAQAQLMRLMTM